MSALLRPSQACLWRPVALRGAASTARGWPSQGVALPEPIHEIVGPDVWLVGDEHTYRVQGAAMEVHDVVAAGVVALIQGRLMRRHEGRFGTQQAGRWWSRGSQTR